MAHVHFLQHVSFEGPGCLADWFLDRGHSLSHSRLHAGDRLPGLDRLDWLVVMGGPMGIYDYDTHPWLSCEKAFIRKAVDAGKVVLGICLGAQLIADTLHAQVRANPEQEIGWFPLEVTAEGRDTAIGALLADAGDVFHWHGDTFEIPVDALHLARSEACENQAFLFGDRVLGLQCHLEVTPAGAAALCRECASELVPAAHVQDAARILASEERFENVNRIMGLILEELARKLPVSEAATPQIA